jgi:glycolate oxidase
VLALEAVLPTGEIVRTGSKAVKNVVGYDLTQLLVGSEGTLAVITEITLRLIPKPQAQQTMTAAFSDVTAAVNAVTRLIQMSVVPAAIELVDQDSLDALRAQAGTSLAPTGSGAALIIEVDGEPATAASELAKSERACRDAGALDIRRAADDEARQQIWKLRRDLSGALKRISSIKLNNDVVVPRGRIPELFELVARLRAETGLPIACFGHAGDGNIHVNIMVPDGLDAMAVARAGERQLFEGVVALEGSISGEHGIGFTKAPYLGLELSREQIALMKRVKAAFDPQGILNPGKIFPEND